jgi:hypothetical protein
MKLYECKRGDRVVINDTDTNVPPAHRPLYDTEVLTFDHIDGMYSYCTDDQGNVVHPAAWTEVQVLVKESK